MLQGRNIIYKNILDVRCSYIKSNSISCKFSDLKLAAKSCKDFLVPYIINNNYQLQ